MKITLIKLQDKFILVSDEEIKEGDWITDGSRIAQVNVLTINDPNKHLHNKIIAGIQEKPICTCSETEANYCNNGRPGKCNYPYPSIDFSLLSEKDCKTIGWLDVEKLAETHVHYYDAAKVEGFIKGFKTAQSLSEKQFSLNEVKGMLFEIANAMRLKSINAYAGYFNDKDMVSNLVNKKLQSLQQTVWDVEVEMECVEERQCECIDNLQCLKPQPKITNNSIKITKIL